MVGKWVSYPELVRRVTSPQGYDYIIYKDGDYVVAKDGRTGKIEFESTDAEKAVQYAVDRGHTIKILPGTYYFRDYVRIRDHQVTIHGSGTNLFGTTRIYISHDNYLEYDIDEDGNVEKIYPAFVITYDDNYDNRKATGTIISGIEFRQQVSEVNEDNQPVAVFANTVSLVEISRCRVHRVGLAFFRGANPDGLTQDEIDNLATNGSYYNRILFNEGYGYNKTLIWLSFFNDANEAIVLGNSNVSLYKTAIFAKADGIRVIGNSFEHNETAIILKKYGNFVANNRYEDNTVDIRNESTGNIIIDRAINVENVANGSLILGTYDGRWWLSYYWMTETEDGFSPYLIFDRYAVVEPLKMNKATINIFRNDSGKYLRKEGSVTLSGDGSSTVIKFEHGMHYAPDVVIVIPNSQDAAGFKYAYADGTYVYVVYDTAPPAGTDNLKYSYILIK